MSLINPFRTIDLGTGLITLSDFERALAAKKCRCNDWAKDILCKYDFTVSPTPLTVDLVRLTNRELGFPKEATFAQTCKAAQDLGLKLCPAEVGQQLRLQYLDQPRRNNWLYIAMKPITDSGGHLSLFEVAGFADGLWLFANYANPERVWHADCAWVFVRRK